MLAKIRKFRDQLMCVLFVIKMDRIDDFKAGRCSVERMVLPNGKVRYRIVEKSHAD